jgi:hypothetical protein
MQLIHYGSNSFNPDKFDPIQNKITNLTNKPLGGLWTSPVNTKYGWKDWCLGNDFNLEKLEKSFTITLKEKANIFIVNSQKDLQRLPFYSEFNNENIIGFRYPKIAFDFEKLAKEYDAIWLTEKGLMDTQDLTFPLNLYGWDCESVLIMNLDCFITTLDNHDL